MHTRRDRETQAATGLVPVERLRALRHALLAEAADALAAARRPGIDERLAAALRGKRKALVEAAVMVQQIADGHSLHPRPHSSARQKTLAARRSPSDSATP